jgi:hypothetical protein
MEYKNFIDGKTARKHPAAMVEERRTLESCVIKTYIGLKDNCAEDYDALDKCLTKNPRNYINCSDLVRKMQKCAVKNEIKEAHPELFKK